MSNNISISKRRQIIGTLLFILATIQIINFAMRDFNRKPIFYYRYEHFKNKSIMDAVAENINYPFKYFNYFIFKLFGYAGLCSPFFFYALGYTFFKRRNEKLSRTRIFLLWTIGEISLFVYVLNYLTNIILPQHVKPGFIAEIFTKYLRKVGGTFFILLFFIWSLTAYLIYIRKSSWQKFFTGVKKLILFVLLGISNIFSHIFEGAFNKKKTPLMVGNNKKNNIKKIEDRSQKTITESKTKTTIKTEPKVVEVTDPGILNDSEVVDVEYTISRIKQFDSTVLRYNFPSNGLNKTIENNVPQNELKEMSTKINNIFNSFGIKLKQTGITTGPQIIRYEYEIPTGMQLKEIEKYKNDLSSRIGGVKINIQIPIPGTNSFGIFIPRNNPDLLGMGSYIDDIKKRDEKIPMFIGVSSEGMAVWTDTIELPHLLIAGATGSGKSVFLNSIIVGFLALSKEIPINLVLIDPKMVEFTPYKNLKQLSAPIITDVDDAREILAEVEKIMEERYATLNKKSVRNISEYNKSARSNKMPFMLVIIDEFADLILQDKSKVIKNAIVRLAQKSRAVGIHLILATQRPSTDVIDGLIKANFPSRVAFRTASQVDSRIIIDENGAEDLLGKGDMIFKSSTGDNYRLQGIYISLDEIKKII